MISPELQEDDKNEEGNTDMSHDVILFQWSIHFWKI